MQYDGELSIKQCENNAYEELLIKKECIWGIVISSTYIYISNNLYSHQKQDPVSFQTKKRFEANK